MALFDRWRKMSGENASSSGAIEAPDGTDERGTKEDQRSTELTARHREAAEALLPDVLAAIETLQSHRDASIDFIRSQGSGYMDVVDLYRSQRGGPQDGWLVSPFPFWGSEPEVLEHETPPQAGDLKPTIATALLVVPFSGESRVSASEGATPALLRAGAPGETMAQVSLTEYVQGARWVHYEPRIRKLFVEAADYSLRGLPPAISKHLADLGVA